MSVNRREGARGVRYDVRLRTPDGRHLERTFRAKREAQRWEAKQHTDAGTGTWIDPGRADTAFAEWAWQWHNASERTKRPKTRARDADVIRLHLEPAFGPRPLRTIAPLDVQKLVEQLAQRLAPGTVRSYYAVLRSILNAAVNTDMLGRSPCRGIRLPSGHASERRIATPDEIHALAEHTVDGYRPMIYVAAELGLRWGEIAGLRVRDLDFAADTVTVAQNVTEAEGRIIIGPPKTRSGIRTIAASEPLMEMLGAHVATLVHTEPNAWLFPAPHGGPLGYASWHHRIWSPARAAADLREQTFHGLRHSATSAWVALGVDPRTAQHRLGHSTPRLVLELYAHAVSDADRAAATKVGAHLYAPQQRATTRHRAP